MFSFSKAADTVALKTVQITEERLLFKTTGSSFLEIDSMTMKLLSHLSLQDILERETGIYFKTYGALSWAAIRGTSSQQNKLLWHGVNFSSNSLGAVDYSLIPSSFISEIQLQNSGNGMNCGQSAMGGCFILKNNFSKEKPLSLELNLSGGSFKRYNEHFKIEYGNEKYSTQTTIFSQQAENNFSFSNITKSGAPIEKQKNAEANSLGIITEHLFKLNNNESITAFGWFTRSDRRIPPVMSSTFSNAHQFDQKLIVGGEYKALFKKTVIDLSLHNSNDVLNYYNPSGNISSISQANTLAVTSEINYKANKWLSLFEGQQISLIDARVSDGYSSTKSIFQADVFAGATIEIPKSKNIIELAVRHQWNDEVNSGLLYSAGMDQRIFSFLKLRGKISTNYRFPTFNDLYWSPGGNALLIPESALNRELGIDIELKQKKIKEVFFTGKISASYFNNIYDNKIVWNAGQLGIWSPANLSKVRTDGTEMIAQIKIGRKNFSFNAQVIYNFTNATLIGYENEDAIVFNRQLSYVPKNKTVGKVILTYKKTGIMLHSNYTGLRYTTDDLNYFLPEVTLYDFTVYHPFNLGGMSCLVKLQCNNVTDESYQWVQNNAMPGRWWMAGITISKQIQTKINSNESSN